MRELTACSIAVVLLMILTSSKVCYSRTWRVPSEIPTIPEAADSAVSGDTVLVAPGTYICPDNLDYDREWVELRSGVTLLGEEGPDSTKIVDLTTIEGHCLVEFEYTADCVVSGFSFVREAAAAGHFHAILTGWSSGWRIESCYFDDFLYAIWAYCVPTPSATPRIRHCRFSRCGIGVFCDSVEPLRLDYPIIRFCTFVDNSWGIECWDAAPYIVDNYIARSHWAGVHCAGRSPATLDRNTIVDGLHYGLWVETEVFYEPYLTTSWVPSNANDIYGNAWCDLCNEVDDQRGLVEACYTYWGDDCPDFERVICGPGRVHYIPWVDSTHTEVYDECPPQTTEPTSWGRIKAMFR
jgi:hypothetical protein